MKIKVEGNKEHLCCKKHHGKPGFICIFDFWGCLLKTVVRPMDLRGGVMMANEMGCIVRSEGNKNAMYGHK